MEIIAEQIAYIGRMMFERRLTDMSGGNISAREGDTLYITPRYAGHKWHWQLKPECIVTGSLKSDALLENPAISREVISHISIYRALPDVKAIIHAHPFHIMPFCASLTPIKSALNATQVFGRIDFIDDAPAYSQEQADHIIAKLRGQEKLMRDKAAAVLMPKHGIFLAGGDLFNVIDSLERIDTNAWCLIAHKMLK